MSVQKLLTVHAINKKHFLPELTNLVCLNCC